MHNDIGRLEAADRLAQPEGQWKPFEPSGVLGMLHQALTHEAVPI